MYLQVLSLNIRNLMFMLFGQELEQSGAEDVAVAVNLGESG